MCETPQQWRLDTGARSTLAARRLHRKEVVAHTRQVLTEGMGVISMKLIGEGAFTTREDRKAAMRFAFNNAKVDSVTVGYKNTAEIDEAIENLNLALA